MKLAKMPDGKAEVYSAVQGEGASMGVPVIFVRLSGCNLHCTFCLVGGTEILMSDGSVKPIETIVKGDKVMAYDLKNKTFIEDEVTETMCSLSTELVVIKLEDGRKLEITPDHEILTERGWIIAGELLTTDIIIQK